MKNCIAEKRKARGLTQQLKIPQESYRLEVAVQPQMPPVGFWQQKASEVFLDSA